MLHVFLFFFALPHFLDHGRKHADGELPPAGTGRRYYPDQHYRAELCTQKVKGAQNSHRKRMATVHKEKAPQEKGMMVSLAATHLTAPPAQRAMMVSRRPSKRL